MTGGTGLMDEIRETFKHGSMLTRLIYINLAVFLLVNVFGVLLYFFTGSAADNTLVNWLAVPADPTQLLYKPWTLITYMFLHKQFLHILFNMLWLYWFGKIFLNYFNGRQLLNLYLLGGISGALLYILAFNTLPVFSDVIPFSVALGASAAVYAIIIATSAYHPEYTVYVLFLGPVKLKYIAAIAIITDIIQLTEGNAGGHIAHLGGALFGYLYIRQFKKGRELGVGFGKVVEAFLGLFKPRKKMTVSYRKGETDMDYNARKNVEQKEIDAILEKIAKSGYNSLSAKEKEMLFRQSKK